MTPVTPQLDLICDAFEDALKSGRAPNVREFASDVDVEGQRHLIRLLLEIELEYAVRNGTVISDDQVYRDYPEYQREVSQAIAAVRGRMESSQKLNIGNSVTESTKDSVRFRIVFGPLAGRDFPFEGHHTLVAGRSRKAQLKLSQDRRLSRFHCRFEIRPPECVVIDLGSRNGTILNGKAVDSATLADGDRIQIGDTCLHFEIVTNKPTAAALMPTVHTNKCLSDVPRTEQMETDVPRIPGYVIETELGQGSMGAVYQAKQLASGRLCAIKVLHPTVTGDRRNIQRFVREASVIMQLRHKRIVESIEFGLAGDAPFLVMEHIQQVPWRSVLESTNLAERIRIVAGIMVRVLEGLHYAHCQKIVHRDLKPSNLLVFQSGRKLSVKLAYFGLAKNFMNAGFSGFSTSNEICGTIAYMPPEQIIDCRNSKPACDIYAAGVCLYYMLSGHVPFEASNVSTQISMILNRKPAPLSDHIAGLPAGLSKLVNRALHREPQKRFASADEMLKTLLPFATR